MRDRPLKVSPPSRLNLTSPLKNREIGRRRLIGMDLWHII